MERTEGPIEKKNQGPRSLSKIEPHLLQYQHMSEENILDIAVSVDIKRAETSLWEILGSKTDTNVCNQRTNYGLQSPKMVPEFLSSMSTCAIPHPRK